MSSIRGARGFSLVELMITVAIAAILLALAFPSFTNLIRSNRVTSATNELVATIMLARTEAIRSPGGAAVCTSSDGASCDAAGNWNTGWIVFRDRNSDGVPTGVNDTVLKFVQGPDAVDITAQSAGGGVDNRLVRFDQRGRVIGTQRRLAIQAEECSNQPLRSEMVIQPTGQVSLDRERKACQ